VARRLLVLAGVLVASGAALGGGAPAAGDVVVNSLGMRMILVPAGSFRMGSPPGEPFRQGEERPRAVTLTRPFRVAATEVTQGQWTALMAFNRSEHEGDGLPVTSVSWSDAREFCSRLSKKEGATYRLPTEAEWEYACRAGGRGTVTEQERRGAAWFADNSGGTTHPVGLKEPNAWGLLDMLGNVAEWTADVYAPYPPGQEDVDPTGPDEGSPRVVRGGAWRSFAPAVRCAARTGTPRSHQLQHVGFRVVQEAP
jgi:formylglycine-generating enzyme required for sulfatase activity